MARTKKDLSLSLEQIVVNLARVGWTNRKIARFVGAPRQTIESRYSAIINAARHEAGREYIERAREMALNRERPSERMLEHLMNRYLGPIPQKHEINKEDLIEIAKDAMDEGGEDLLEELSRENRETE